MIPEGTLLHFADSILDPWARVVQRQLAGLLLVIDGMRNLDGHALAGASV